MLSYTYDGQNQLTTVKNGSGTTLYSYGYDTMGNIRSKTDGSVTHLYTYGNSQWADLLTAYDGHTITYDGSGNPLSYYNGADYTFTWEQGRQLASVTKGNKTASYTYDMSGVRSGKTVNGVSYEYTTLSGKITRMTWSGNAVDIVYDDAGRPYILRYTPSGGATQTYYYVLNLQGDVVGLMNTSMQMVVRYSYDPWGKLTGTTATSAYVALAQANPLRYRSYCYDIETGFYYLQTRYYDPAIARFINADSYLTTDITGFISSNMFAYCENNPIMGTDPTGKYTFLCRELEDDDEKENRTPKLDLELGATFNPINGQAICEYAEMKFGETSTVAESGCAVIALYNALTAKGYSISFEKTLRGCEGVNILPCSLGVWPGAINRFLYCHGVPYEKFCSQRKLQDSMKNGDVAIVTYWTQPFNFNAHTVAVQMINDSYYVYNKGNYNAKVSIYDSLDEVVSGGFIYGGIINTP